MAALEVSGDVIDECLNHKIESRVRRTYVRDRRLAAQARAFDDLAQHLFRILGFPDLGGAAVSGSKPSLVLQRQFATADFR